MGPPASAAPKCSRAPCFLLGVGREKVQFPSVLVVPVFSEVLGSLQILKTSAVALLDRTEKTGSSGHPGIAVVGTLASDPHPSRPRVREHREPTWPTAPLWLLRHSHAHTSEPVALPKSLRPLSREK